MRDIDIKFLSLSMLGVFLFMTSDASPFDTALIVIACEVFQYANTIIAKG